MFDPTKALAHLRDSPVSPFHDTRLSEDPFWFSFAVPKEVELTPLTIEFPSRHAVDFACWDAKTLNLLGAGNHQHASGSMSEVKAGFALALNPLLKDSQVVCRTHSIGPARISALKWQTSDLQISEHEFHRKSGLLDGGILILAAFVLITAWINRSPLYVLFAAWLVVNLRMAALSAGSDAQWLGNTVPQDWLIHIREITLAAYYVLSVILFRKLFQDDLSKVGSLLLLRIALWTCLPLLLLSAVLPYQSFLPLLWTSTGLSSCIMVFFLWRILRRTRSRVAVWYGASVSITIVASLYEVLAAALGIKGLIGSVNSVTAALSSSLL
ncbi:MAG: 7TM diverse intracellular signaling domain-containing protein, partial [Comamonadaceae bacterium]